MKVSNEHHRLKDGVIYDLICVDRPYFALRDLKENAQGSVTAVIEFESDNEYERSLSSAEIGRHLAILGSCALASLHADDTEKYFYLATSAKLVRYPHNVDRGSLFVAKGRAELLPGRVGRSELELLTVNGQLLAELSVQYNIVPVAVFQRFNKAHRQEISEWPNPYSTPTPVELNELTSKGIKASISKIDPRHCAGHFANYPSLPVAVLMDILNRLVGRHMKDCFPDLKFYFLTCDVAAENLAFAGQSISFEVRQAHQNDGTITYSTRAYSSEDESTIYGLMDISYLSLSKDDEIVESNDYHALLVR